ncbi:sensor histidine kinase [Metabacillus halosaccharovorans]|uniref:sensor histidine kinase n=1 Tax=Metabacillus halosaccharovorans TaxID=930124 RepID=UPI001C1F37DB|nr:histidine kinase [Metabacillus halosaccharovorans]MBU7595736.1 HAMP domain-containing protein [Metabacillus halosaccharovorans]
MRNKSSIYLKLVFAFFLAVMPIYLLTGFLYNWSINIIKEDITESAQMQSSVYLDSLEASLERMSLMQYELLEDPFLLELEAISKPIQSYRQIELIQNVQARLSSILNSSPFIRDVRVSIPSANIVISATGGYGILNGESKEANPIEAYKLIQENNQLVMKAIPLDSEKQGMPPVFSEIELSKGDLQNELLESIQKDYSYSISLDINDQLILGENVTPKSKDEISLTPFLFFLREDPYLQVIDQTEEFNITLRHFILKDEIFSSINRMVYWFWLFVFITFFFIIVYFLYVNRAIHKPLITLLEAFKNVENNQFDTIIRYEKRDEFQYIYNGFNHMVSNIQSLIDKVYKQTILLQKAELKQLQSQINPHFLYNCLFSIVRMIKLGKKEEAIYFVEHLAQYFRFITRNEKDTVTLEKEAEHAEHYAKLQVMRFSPRIEIAFKEVPATMKGIIVPRLILQPIVENAFLHGLENKLENGILTVSFQEEEDFCIIAVEDNGEEGEEAVKKMNERIYQPANQDISALPNVHRRLQSYFGLESGVQVYKVENGGIKVNLRIKLGGNRNV